MSFLSNMRLLDFTRKIILIAFLSIVGMVGYGFTVDAASVAEVCGGQGWSMLDVDDNSNPIDGGPCTETIADQETENYIYKTAPVEGRLRSVIIQCSTDQLPGCTTRPGGCRLKDYYQHSGGSYCDIRWGRRYVTTWIKSKSGSYNDGDKCWDGSVMQKSSDGAILSKQWPLSGGGWSEWSPCPPKPPQCGDAVIDKELDEECDEGKDRNGKAGSVCTDQCKFKLLKQVTIELETEKPTSDREFFMKVRFTGWPSAAAIMAGRPEFVVTSVKDHKKRRDQIGLLKKIALVDLQPTAGGWNVRIPVTVGNEETGAEEYEAMVKDNAPQDPTDAIFKFKVGSGCTQVLEGGPVDKEHITLTFLLPQKSENDQAKAVAEVRDKLIAKGLAWVEPYKSNIEKFNVFTKPIDGLVDDKCKEGTCLEEKEFNNIADIPHCGADLTLYYNPDLLRSSQFYKEYAVILLAQAANKKSDPQIRELVEKIFVHEIGHFFGLLDEYYKKWNDEFIDKVKKSFSQRLNCAPSLSDVTWKNYVPGVEGGDRNESLYSQIALYTGNAANCFDSSAKPIAGCKFQVAVEKKGSNKVRDLIFTPHESKDDCQAAVSGVDDGEQPIKESCMVFDKVPQCLLPGAKEFTPCSTISPEFASDGYLMAAGCFGSVNSFKPTINSLMADSSVGWTPEQFSRSYGVVNEYFICEDIARRTGTKPKELKGVCAPVEPKLKFFGDFVLTAIASNVPTQVVFGPEECGEGIDRCLLLMDKDWTSAYQNEEEKQFVPGVIPLIPQQVMVEGKQQTQYVALVTPPPLEPFEYTTSAIKSTVTYVLMGKNTQIPTDGTKPKPFIELAEAVATFTPKQDTTGLGGSCRNPEVSRRPSVLARVVENTGVSVFSRVALWWSDRITPLKTMAQGAPAKECHTIGDDTSDSGAPRVSLLWKVDNAVELQEATIKDTMTALTRIKPFNEFAGGIRGVVDTKRLDDPCLAASDPSSASFAQCARSIADKYQYSCSAIHSFVVIVSNRVYPAWKISGASFVVVHPGLSPEEMAAYIANAIGSWLGLADEFEYSKDAALFTKTGPNCLPVAGKTPPSSWREKGITAVTRGCGDFPGVGLKPSGQTIMNNPRAVRTDPDGFGAFNQQWIRSMLQKASSHDTE